VVAASQGRSHSYSCVSEASGVACQDGRTPNCAPSIARSPAHLRDGAPLLVPLHVKMYGCCIIGHVAGSFA
jgi:hypothetical protein